MQLSKFNPVFLFFQIKNSGSSKVYFGATIQYFQMVHIPFIAG
jgi:hypothetical protein